MTASNKKEIAHSQQAFYTFVVIPWFAQRKPVHQLHLTFPLIAPILSRCSCERFTWAWISCPVLPTEFERLDFSS
jgi:hypothetical protein